MRESLGIAPAKAKPLREFTRQLDFVARVRSFTHDPAVFRFCAFFFTTTAVIAAAEQTLGWARLPPLPEPVGVAGPYAGAAGGALLVAGGANFPIRMPWEGGEKVWRNQVWILEKPA